MVGSAKQAEESGASLALIRPRNSVFKYRRKTDAQLHKEREAYVRAASQGSFFDKALAALEPSPYRFGFSFEDDAGPHAYQCGDWEVHAMFFHGVRRYGEQRTLAWMNETFNVRYPAMGMAFALGNMAKRPHTWQLLGVVRLAEEAQPDLFG